MKKGTIEQLKALAASRGGQCLSPQYKGGHHKHLWKCENSDHKPWEATASSIKTGSWCPECGKEKRAKNRVRGSLKEIQAYAKKRGGKCTNTEFDKLTSYYSFECKNGHTWTARFDNMKYNNTWCSECYYREKAGKYRLGTIKELCFIAKERGGKCLSTQYIGNHYKHLWKCGNKEHEAWWATAASIKTGSWCPRCGNESRVKKQTKYTIQDLQDYAKKINGLCLSTKFFTVSHIYKWQCNKHDKPFTWPASFSNVLAGKWCPRCAKVQSNLEIEVYEFIKTLIEDKVLLKNKPAFMNNKELDIYVPSLNFAIEFHGLVWHSSKFNKNYKTLHKEKYELCKKAGVHLVQIFEDEWLEKPEIVKSIIKNKLNLAPNKVFARKTEVVLLNKKQKEEFFNKNHIYGDTKSTKCWGLVLNGEIVSALSVRKPYTKKHKGKLEIARFASKVDAIVVGGFSRLFGSVKKQYPHKSIITYSDLRFGEGQVYLQNKFSFVKRLSPNYFYTNKRIREGRFKHRKNNDPDFIAKYGNTELEQNYNQGWYAIYDVGHNLYEYTPAP